MSEFQQVACPRCGRNGNVHSIAELAALARAQLGQLQGGFPGQPGGVPGYLQEPVPGQPGGEPGYLQEPVPGQPGGVPGYLQEPRPGPRGRPPRRYPGPDTTDSRDFSLGDDLAGLAITETAKFVGRRIGRRLQRAYADRVEPALAARGEERLRTMIAIAERHPDICACMDDNVVFLAGGRSVLPMPDLNSLTVDQADTMVTALRQG